MPAPVSQDLPAWLRWSHRAPNALYDHGPGRLLGHRFVQVGHIGRASGRRHHAVVEVVSYDRHSGEAVVVSGYGRRADWFRNIVAAGGATLDCGGGPGPAAYRILPPQEADSVYAAYERRNLLIAPVIRPTLTALLGRHYDGSPQARRRMVEQLPMMAFRPA